jgi:ethanolamine utilization microcompartment shell protein EutS
MRSGASWFFFIAGLSLVNSVLFWAGSNIGFVIGLGFADAANAIGHDLVTGTTGAAIAIVFDIAIAAAFAGIGYLARKGATWAFIVGGVVYALDALLLAWATDWLSVAFHALALFYIFRGFQASRALGASTRPPTPPTTTTGIAPPIHPR